MSFTYENQGTSTYLVYTLSAGDIIDSMSLGMLVNNKIPGLASTLFTQMDSTKYIKYNVSAHIAVSQFFAGAVNKKRLLGVFKGIVSAILSAEDYMIDESAILLDLDYIFADVTTCDTVLICLPVNHEIKCHDLGVFFKGIMFSTQFDQAENCDYVARIINFLNSSPLFSLNDFKELLEKIEKGDVSRVPAVQASQVIMQPAPQQPKVENKPAVQPQVKQPIAQANGCDTPVPVFNNHQPAVSDPVNVGVNPAIPVVPAQQSTEQGKNKGFSLFGLRSSKDKKDKKEAKKPTAKQPAKQSVKQPAKQNPGFDVPGQPAAINPQPVVPRATTDPQPIPQMVQRPVNNTSVVNPPVQQPVIAQPVYAQPQMPQGQAMNFGETTVLGGGAIGETTVLGATPDVQVRPHLIRTKNNEKIDLNKPIFRIGKEKSYVDYFIGDNSAISRSHANIVSRDDEYFVIDTNSTNHTYVNGQMIQSNVATKIAHGAKIKLANEDFEFRLY